MARRLSKGQSPMTGDREHLHHMFQRAGFSVGATFTVVTGWAFVLGGVGVLGWRLDVPEWLMWPPLVLVLVGHNMFVSHAWRAMRVLRRVHERSLADADQ